MTQKTETQWCDSSINPAMRDTVSLSVLLKRFGYQIVQKVISRKWRRRFWNWLLRDASVRLYQFVTSQVISFLCGV